jgi:hypothetical protein
MKHNANKNDSREYSFEQFANLHGPKELFTGIKSQVFKPQKLSRSIGMKYSGLTGRMNSSKTNDTISFESSLERDYILLLEFDKNVKSFCELPITVEYERNNRTQKYTPDFFISYHQNYDHDEIVEVKYSQDLKINKDKYAPKFNAAFELCNNHGLEFNIVTEKEIRSDMVYLNNLRFLFTYKNYYHSFSNEFRLSKNWIPIQIQKKIYESDSIIVNDLITELSRKFDVQKEEILFYIWVLVVQNFIDCDKRVQISLNTVLWKDLSSS